jgi:hypothetical protein
LLSVRRRDEIEALLIRICGRIVFPVKWLVLRLLRVLGLLRPERGVPLFDLDAAEPHLDAEAAALRELERIEALGLPDRGLVKDYYTLVSQAVRRYLERRYGILALESPTSFTVAAISDLAVGQKAVDLTGDILEEADLVKFAKHSPAARVVAGLTDRARRIVSLTGVPPADPLRRGDGSG